MVIQTVQVGVMTAFVPPGSFILGGTVFGPAVIILIFGAKGLTTMTRKGITGSSCKTKTTVLNTFHSQLSYLFNFVQITYRSRKFNIVVV